MILKIIPRSNQTMSIFATLSLIFLYTSSCYCQQLVNLQKDFMVCRPLANVFGTVERTINNVTEELPVIQGAMGPPGPRGPTGQQGLPGVADYKKVSQIVEEKLQVLNGRLYALEKSVNAMKTRRNDQTIGGSVAETTDLYSQQCLDKFSAPIAHGDQCFAVLGSQGVTYKIDAAGTLCSERGGHLADINSREMYNILYDYIDHTFSVVVDAWIGMTYENDRLLTFDGSPAIYAKWAQNYPRDSSRSYYTNYNAVAIFVDTSSNIKRLTNLPRTSTKNFAVCQFSLKPEDATSTVRTITHSIVSSPRIHRNSYTRQYDKKK